MAKPSKPGSEPKVTPAPVNVAVIADHYQKTFEVAYDYWKERNKIFIYLVLTTILGLLIIQRGPLVNELLVKYTINYFELSEETDHALISEISRTIPFNVLLSGILVTMFYFMQRLYSTNLSVMRTFLYLSAIEDEIQPHLGLSEKNASFTREGRFYWGNRSFTQSISKWYYVIVLFFLLIPFIVTKLGDDWGSSPWLVTSVDVIVSMMTIAYWVEYARSSLKLDRPKADSTELKTKQGSSKSRKF